MSDPPLPPSDDDAPGDPLGDTPESGSGGAPSGGEQANSGAAPGAGSGDAERPGQSVDPDELDLSQLDDLIGLGRAESSETQGETPTEALGETLGATLGDDAPTEVLGTSPEPTAVIPPIDGAGDLSVTQQIRRKRVSHRRYVARRALVGLAALAVVGGAVLAAVLLMGGDDDEPDASERSVPVATSEPAAAETTEVQSTTTAAEPTSTTAAATSSSAAPTTTRPSATPGTGGATSTTAAPTTTRPRTTTTTPAASDSEPSTTGTPSGDLPTYDLDKSPDCEMQGSVQLGESGPDVACLEERLEEVTVGGVSFEVDEVFDEDTEAAVRQFQEANNLIVDGEVGPESGQLLRIWPGSNDAE